MNANLHPVIGVNLGTTLSTVAAWNTALGQAVMIPDRDHGDAETTPSVIGLEDAGQGRQRAIVGWDAKRNLPNDPRNTVIEIKREMGAVFSNETLAKYGAVGRFKVHKPPDPLHVRFAGQWLRPQELSAFTLMRMKQLAEAEFGRPIHDAVITVPACFKENQRKATEEAALLAGLYPRQLITEPTAAAICYGVDQDGPFRRVYLVYNLGGGMFDVSIIEVEDSRINVIATSGDPRLGGGNFDDRITAWTAAMLEQQYGIRVAEVEAIPDPRTGQSKYYVVRQPLQADALARIKAKAEEAKIALSTDVDTTLPLTFLAGPAGPPTLTLTRKVFLGLIDDLLARSVDYVKTALGYAREKGVRPEDISAVLLVGGSSKIPRVRELLMEHFRKDEEFVRNDADPDQVVARGAAIMARRFEPSKAFDLRKAPTAGLNKAALEDDMIVHLITEHSLGVGVQDKKVYKIVPRGTNLPLRYTSGGFTNGGPTDYIDVEVYQGEGDMVHQNTMIGLLKIGPMEPRAPGYHRFDVTFSLSTDGLLTTTVHHLNEGRNYQGQFNQATTIGAEMLAKRHEALRAMFTTGVEMIGARPPIPAEPRPIMPHQVTPPTAAPVVLPQNVQPGGSVGPRPTTATPAPEITAAHTPAAPAPAHKSDGFRCLCPHCGARIFVRHQFAGKLATCPACKRKFQLPGSPGPSQAKDGAAVGFKAQATGHPGSEAVPVPFGDPAFASLSAVAFAGSHDNMAGPMLAPTPDVDGHDRDRPERHALAMLASGVVLRQRFGRPLDEMLAEETGVKLLGVPVRADLYARNPLRVLAVSAGLGADALKGMINGQMRPSPGRAPRGSHRPIATGYDRHVDAIRAEDLIAALGDARRLLFWELFWPHEAAGVFDRLAGAGSLVAPAILDLCRSEKVEEERAALSIHAEAVLNHNAAIAFECAYAAGHAATPVAWWDRALALWGRTCGDDRFWAYLMSRAKQLDCSGRLATRVPALRTALPAVLLSINGALARGYVRAGQQAAGLRHLGCMSRSGLGGDALPAIMRIAAEAAYTGP